MRRLLRLGPHPILIARTVLHRAGRALADRALRRRYERLVARVPDRVSMRSRPLDVRPAEELPEPLRDAAEGIRREADAALAHRIDLLGSGPVELGDPIDWHRDFKDGFAWPRAFYLDVPVTRLDDGSDAKVPWDLSRGHQLVALARAAALFREERYAAELEAQLAHWLDDNPPGVGINWVNPMEIGLRAASWVWAVDTLESWRPLEPGLRRRVAESLHVHGAHIRWNLEAKPYLRSNHYISDLLGLVVVAEALGGSGRSRRWLRFAHRELEREILGQVHDDGVGFEGSLPYHGLSFEIFLVSRIAAERAGRPFSRRYDERLGRMLDVSRAVRHPNGRIPQFGDNDSGRILPAGSGRPPTHDHLLWTGAAALGRPAPLPGPPHEEVAWNLGLSAWEEAASRAPAPEPGTTGFPAGGLYVLRDERAHAVVRCAGVGQGGNGGHGHNDALSYELSYRGEPVAVDSGTYTYTADPGARNELRATAAHNTVRVDGLEINPIEPHEIFRMPQVATPVVERWEPDRPLLVASHDGYERLDPPATHRRTVELSGGVLSVADEVTGGGERSVEVFVHLAPGTDPQRVAFEGADSVEVTEGWVSDRYGVRERAPVVVARRSG
ncbi:MAG: heparinase II/III family protein, partial [Actinomycetota bacterium]|nr:heparinase II/III family protein [Actinomycetota bacterium]